ncbi:MAG: sigma-E processing peptidase SpoIIGA [Clostridia bacterium]|nr:sigma-E processing peptidase SpoIIGA [Clostridia bacterium]
MALDLLMDMLALAMALRLEGRRIRPWRLALGAALGAAGAKGISLLSLPRVQAAALWIPLAFAMRLAADGGALARPVRGTLVLLAAFGLLGGVISALYGALGTLAPAYALGLGVAVLSAASSIRSRRAAGDAERLRIALRFRGREAEFEAIADSGNCLRDYLTHRPVIVLPETEGRRKLALDDAPLRPIFADTAGGRQMMGCFTPELAAVVTDRGRRSLQAAVALSPGLGGDAPALVPGALLSEAEI